MEQLRLDCVLVHEWLQLGSGGLGMILQSCSVKGNWKKRRRRKGDKKGHGRCRKCNTCDNPSICFLPHLYDKKLPSVSKTHSHSPTSVLPPAISSPSLADSFSLLSPLTPYRTQATSSNPHGTSIPSQTDQSPLLLNHLGQYPWHQS